MNKTFLCVSALALTVGTTGYLGLAPRTEANKEKFVYSSSPAHGRYIVVLNGDTSDQSAGPVDQQATELKATYGGEVRHVFSDSVRGYSVQMTEHDARRLSADPRVEYVEEDSIVEAQDVVTNPDWALDRIDQRQLPFDLLYRFESSGAGVNVYIVDSGILTTHEALLGRAFDAYNATGDTNPVENCNGHGTGVAGVVASSNYGTARSAYVHSVRVLPCTGPGYLSDVVAGVDWITRNAIRPAVANMSLRSTYSRTLNSSVTAAIRSGVTMVVAAGNDSGDACNYSPASVRDALTVGGINSADTKLSYSNFGSCVSLFAPGEGVSTIWNAGPPVTYMSGTSFASPYVAGVAALYLADHPTASPGEVKSAIVRNATSNVVAGAGAGSPNLLLYSLFSTNQPGGCNGDSFVGALTAGTAAFQSGPEGFSTRNGDFAGSLAVSDGAMFALTLEKKAKTRWSDVATTYGTSSLQISYRGRSGIYRWRIDAVSGSGNYTLCSDTP